MRIVTVFCLILVAVFSISGQAGRRPEPTPTPTPVTNPVSTTYSESEPQKKRPVQMGATPRADMPPKPSPTPRVTKPRSSPVMTSVDGDVENVGRVETNLVTIPVSVFDRHGIFIPNLKQEDFKIFEDGKEQKIEYFGTSEKPFTVILLLDTSPSTAYEIDEIHASATAFVDQLKPHDKVMVIEFDGKIRVLTEATGDRPTIYKAINKAEFGDGTSLYDAVAFSLSQRLKAISGRKAIVLFSDGVDTMSSKANYDSTLAMAEEAEALIFPIYYDTFEKTRQDTTDDGNDLPPPGTTAREYDVGKKYLEELAGYTGGRVFRPEATPGGLTAAFQGIAEELRRQYNIGYIPIDDGKPGQRKQIKVRVYRPNLVLRARDSYIVGSR